MTDSLAAAWLGGQLATGLMDVTADLTCLESAGKWAVSVTFEGEVNCARFADWRPTRGTEDLAGLAGGWRGPSPTEFVSSLDGDGYRRAVTAIRESIAKGDVYQANLCRVLSAALPDPRRSDIFGLATLLAAGNPAPYAGCLRLPERGLHVACASPELFLSRNGVVVESGPIKGTGRVPADLTDKDRAENVMIVDLVRNDLGRVCEVGSVTVPSLLRLEHHPTVVHLVSTVAGVLREEVSWRNLIEATFPPGSVSGAPKSSALDIIESLEPAARRQYCGAFGWVDAENQTAELAVAIRTFWISHGSGSTVLNFGTGAGITWGSDPDDEWHETELKAAHLLGVAAGEWR